MQDSTLHEPPKDKPIIALGRIICSDEFSTTCEPFCNAIIWEDGGWHFFFESYGVRMSVARTLEDKVIIHHWTEMP